MSRFKSKFGRVIDILLSPPPTFVKLTYNNRIKLLAKQFFLFKNPITTFIHLFRLILMKFLAYLLLPISMVLKKSGYRFATMDLSQIGALLYLDLFLRENALYKKVPRNKMFLLASKYTDANIYILDLYNQYAHFIRNPFLKFLLSPFFMSPLFNDNYYKYDLNNGLEYENHKIWNDYYAKYNKNLICFPEADIRKTEGQLFEFIPKKMKFVCLHVRDSGFYNIESQTIRNADIDTYKCAIKFLIEKGYAVIRLGDNKMVKIDGLKADCGPLLFDYAFSSIRSEMMDAYLLSHCEFYIGGSSGPTTAVMCFGTNSCNVNWYNASNAPSYIDGDITTFKKIRYKKDGSLVAFDCLFTSPYSENASITLLDSYDLYVEDNTEQEIFETVKEYIENSGNSSSKLQNFAKSKILKINQSYGAKGNFSETILKQYLMPNKEV